MKEMVDEQFIKNNVRIEGIEHLDKVLAQGNGGVIVTAHIGNWELGAVLLSVLGYPLMAIALPHKERPVNDLFNDQRETKGVTVVSSNGALRRCIKQLRDNKLVALVADRDFGEHGIEMDFLGRRMLVPKGPVIFSMKTGAPIIPMFLIRSGKGKFSFSCSEPIYPPDRSLSVNDEESMKKIMDCYMSVIEEKVRAYPSQWLLFREFSVK
jgi:lauroyl/myristoyl acyltransferase